MTLTELEKLEALHAHGSKLAVDELYNAFPALAKALREAWKEREDYRNDARLSDCMLDEIVELVGSGGDGSAKGSVEAMLYEMKERTEKQDAALMAARAELAKARTLASQLRDEREEAVEALENLEGVIRDNIPYHYDQGEADEDEANSEECVEYAAADIAKLKADVEKLRHLLARLIEEGTADTHSISSECIRLVEAEIKGYEYTLPERDRP